MADDQHRPFLLRAPSTPALQRYRPSLSQAACSDLAAAFLTSTTCSPRSGLIAASFGARHHNHQMPDPRSAPSRHQPAGLASTLLTAPVSSAADATGAKRRISWREQYIAGCFELAALLHPAAVPSGIDPTSLSFAPGPEPDPIAGDDGRCGGVRQDIRNGLRELHRRRASMRVAATIRMTHEGFPSQASQTFAGAYGSWAGASRHLTR